MKTAVTFRNPFQKTRFWLLAFDAAVAAAIQFLHPLEPKTNLGKFLSQFPLVGVEGIYIGIVVLMVMGWLFSNKVLRVAHAVAVFLYTVNGIALLLLLFVGEPGFNGAHSIVIAWLHMNAGIDLPPLSKRTECVEPKEEVSDAEGDY